MSSFSLRLIFLVICVLATLSSALYRTGSKVLQLSSGNFDSAVLQSKKAVFVKFYSPNCGHCVRLKPAWEGLADNMSDHVEIAAINCQENGDICNRYQIRGYPTMKIFGTSEADDKRIILDYNGSRELKDMAAFSKRHATSFVYLIKSEVSDKEKSAIKRTVTYNEFVSKAPELPKAIFFKAGPSYSVSLPLKSLSVRFFRKVVIAQMVLGTLSLELVEKYQIPTDRDSFIILPPVGTQRKYIYHNGALTFSSLSEFLSKYSEVRDWDKLEL